MVICSYTSFEEWEGTRRHPHLVEHEAYALIIGIIAYTEDGRKDLNAHSEHPEFQARTTWYGQQV